jgi:hypothetical protein
MELPRGAEQRHHPHPRHRRPCFPMYGATFGWGNIDHPKFDQAQLSAMKSTCQQHCFSTLNHNLAYFYNDAQVIKWLWSNARNKFQGGVRSFED